MQIYLGFTDKYEQKEKRYGPSDNDGNINHGHNAKGRQCQDKEKTAIEEHKAKLDKAIGDNHEKLEVKFDLPLVQLYILTSRCEKHGV